MFLFISSSLSSLSYFPMCVIPPKTQKSLLKKDTFSKSLASCMLCHTSPVGTTRPPQSFLIVHPSSISALQSSSVVL